MKIYQTILIMIVIMVSSCNINKNEKQNFVVKIMDTKITRSEFLYFLNIAKEPYEKMANINKDDENERKIFWKGKLPGKNLSTEQFVKEQALGFAIDFAIQYIRCKDIHMILSEEESNEINQEITKFISDKNGEFNANEYLQKHIEMNISDYRTFLNKWYLVKKYMEFEKKNIDISDQKLRDYYEKEKDSFDQVSVRHILLSKNNRNTQNLAEQLYQKIIDGEDIGVLAQEYSEDISTKQNKGEYIIVKSKISNDFEANCFDKKVGEVSIFKTDNDIHIYKILDAKKDFNDLLEDIKNSYIEMKYSEKLEEWRESEKYKIQIESSVYDKINILG